MRRILKGWGCDVHAADSVAAALQTAAAISFDVLISDIGLPDGSGLDLMRQLLARGPVQGIALSGFGMDEDLARSRDSGFRGAYGQAAGYRPIAGDSGPRGASLPRDAVNIVHLAHFHVGVALWCERPACNSSCSRDGRTTMMLQKTSGRKIARCRACSLMS